jgi:hypothetical protein
MQSPDGAPPRCADEDAEVHQEDLEAREILAHRSLPAFPPGVAILSAGNKARQSGLCHLTPTISTQYERILSPTLTKPFAPCRPFVRP